MVNFISFGLVSMVIWNEIFPSDTLDIDLFVELGLVLWSVLLDFRFCISTPTRSF